ncbi:kelch-like protein diablo [Hydractinia symbiolongicarpus]|uniref:kelch-like protein diablo n=1 Tax=Hydractinia symbiolongicarpus TaxID=13093 RepID=UPI00254CF508|nr:kelch-like protein diablo [Hydractinia symbiolongicarpus]
MSVFRSPYKTNRQFWDFTQSADLVLQVEGRKFYVHRSILSHCSPVFQVMLESDHFIEKHQTSITFPDKNSADIQQLLNFIYPFGHQITENTDVESLLNLSREYQIKKIKDLCEAYLLRKVPTIDQLIIAQEYDLPLLKDKCLKQLSDKALNGLQDHPRFSEINDKNRILIMEQQLKKLQVYCKKISQIAQASDMRFMPIITHIHCGHKPKNCNNPHFICQVCKASTLRSFIKEESWKLGQDKSK